MKALKIFLGIFVTFFIFVIGAGLLAHHFVDLNKYIPKVEARLQEETGLEWTIQGPVKLALFPGAILSVNGISAVDKGGAKVPQFIGQSFSFESARAKVSWFPQIMRKEITIKEFSLDTLSYSKKATDGAMQKIRLDRLAIKDIYVGFSDIENTGLVIHPQNADKGIGLDLDAEFEQFDKAGKITNEAQIDFKASVNINADAPLQKINLQDVQTDVNIKTPQLQESGLDAKVTADIALDLGAKTLSVSHLKVAAINEEITGDANVSFAQKEPKISFDLMGDDVSLDGLFALMAQKGGEGNGEEGDVKARGKAAKPLPKFTVDGQFALTKLKMADLFVDSVDMKFKGRGGTYSIAPLNAELYGGSVTMGVDLKGGSVPAKCSVHFDLNNVRLGTFLKAVANKDMIDGALHSAGDVAFPCLAGPIDIAKANGAINTSISNGVIQKWNVSKVLNQAQSVARALDDGALTDMAALQSALNVRQGDEAFEFTKILANITLANGVAKNTVFDMKAPLSDVKGHGQFDLVKQIMDYNVRLNLSKTKDNNKYFVPIKLSGPFTKPSYKIDTQKLLSSQLGDKVKNKIKNELDGKLGDEIDGALGEGLLKALPF